MLLSLTNCLLLQTFCFWPSPCSGRLLTTIPRVQILQAIGIDYIDESEVLTPADEQHHINKHTFRIPFVCGCTSLGQFS
jgi:hypothetical protein